MATPSLVLFEAERRRRERLGLPPLEAGATPGAIEAQPLPETAGDFGREAERGLQQFAAAPFQAAGETLETVGGFLPGQMVSGAGRGIAGFGERLMPEKPVEGVGGAIISGLGRAPVDLLKIGGAMKLMRPMFAGRAGAAASAALEAGASEAAAAEAATKAARIASYMHGSTTFGALGAAETAGMQLARQDGIDLGEIAKAGLRGAATGAAWEAFAPFNVVARMAGLGVYGATEAVAFGEDPAEAGVMTAMYGAMGGLKGRDFRGEGRAAVTEAKRISVKQAEAEAKAMSEGKSEERIADEGVAVIPEVMDAAKVDPELHATLLGNLNSPGATTALAKIRQSKHEIELRAAGAPAEDIVRAGKQKFQETLNMLEDVKTTHNAYIEAETRAIKENVEQYKNLKVDIEIPPEDMQQRVGAEMAARDNARKSLGVTPAEANYVAEWAANTRDISKGLRVEVKNIARKVSAGVDVSPLEWQRTMKKIDAMVPQITTGKGEFAGGEVPELGALQAGRMAGTAEGGIPPVTPREMPPGAARAGVEAFGTAMEPAIRGRGGTPARLGEAQAEARKAYENAPKVDEATKAVTEGQAAERAAREARTTGDVDAERRATTVATTEKAKAKKAAEAPKSEDFKEHVEKGIEAGLESSKVAKDQAAEAARMRGEPVQADPDISPRTKFSSMAQSVFGKAEGQTLTRLADAFAMWQSIRGGVSPTEWWSKIKLETQSFRDYVAQVAAAEGAKPYAGKASKGQLVRTVGGIYAVKAGTSKGGQITLSDIATGAELKVKPTKAEMEILPGNVKDGMPKGLTEFTNKGERIIRAFETADVSTGAHELAHVFRRDLRGEDLRFINEQFGVGPKQKNWTRAQEEKFAKTFEYWLKTGKSKRKALVPILQQFREWLGSIYDAVMPGGKSKKSGELPEGPYFNGIEVSPQMSKFFNDMFAFRELRQPEGAADAYRQAESMGGPEILNQSSGAFEAPIVAGNAVFDMVKRGTMGTGEIATRGLKWAVNGWSRPLVDSVAAWRPALGASFRSVGDTAHRIVGGFYPDYRKLSIMLEQDKYIKAANDLMEIVEVEGTNAGIARIATAIEGKKLDMSPAEADIVKQVQKMIELQAKMAEGNHELTKGALIFQMGKDGKFTKFKGREGGQILLQQFTGDAYHALEMGSGLMYDAWVAELSRMNNVPVDVGRRMVESMGKKILQSRSAFEVTRDLPEFPTHLRINGKWVPIIETNPLKFSERLINNTAMRLSFIKEFGKVGDIWTNAELLDGGKLEAMVEQFAGTGEGAYGRRQLMRDTLRALNGIPVEMKPRFGPEPGSRMYDVVRFAKFMESGLKTALLTRSLIPNIPESLGNTQAYGGMERYAKALKMIAEDPKMWAIETARSGARTAYTQHKITEPSRMLESYAIRIRDWIGRKTGHMPFNELNELHAAVVGHIFSNDAQAGRLHVGDAQRLNRLKFTEPQIKQLMEFKNGDAATPELQDLWHAIKTRFPEATQGTTSFAAERSRLANSRIYKHMIFADSYAQMKFDRTMREIGNLWNEMHPEEGVWKRPSKASMKAASSYFMGSAASGLSASFLVAFAAGGPAGVSAWFEQAEDDRMSTILEATKYNVFGGPADAIWRSVTNDNERSILGQLGEATLPGNVIQEGFDLFHGYGRYKNRTLPEKALEFMKSEVSASKPVLTWLAVAGMGKDPEVTAAKSAFWKWRRDELPAGRFTKSDLSKSDSDKAFGINMRRAYDAMTEGDMGKADESVAAALQNSGREPNSAKASIRMRVMLKSEFSEKTEVGRKNRESLRKRIGERAFNALLRHDNLLKAWAGRL